MPTLPPSLQITLLVTGGFLLGILFTWLYWRRKMQKKLDHTLFDREREIEKLRAEMDLLEIEGTKVSPSEYVRSKKSVLFRKDEKIAQLQRELDHLQVDGQRVSASYFIIKSQKELEAREQEILQLKSQLSALGHEPDPNQPIPVSSDELEEKKAEIQQLKSLLGTFTHDGKEVSPIEYMSIKREEIEGLKKEIEQYKAKWEEDEARVAALPNENEPIILGQSLDAPQAGPSSFPTEEGQPTFEYKGESLTAEAFQEAVKQDLISREHDIQQLKEELDSLLMNNEEGKFLSPGEAFSQLKKQLEEKDAEIARLSSEFDLLLDEDNADAEKSLSPKEAFAKLKNRLAEKEAEIESLNKQILTQDTGSEPDTPQKEISPSEAFAAMQRVESTEEGDSAMPLELGQLKEELASKSAELESFRSLFDFLPKAENEEEAPTPEMVFNDLKEEIVTKDLEITHFNEELAQLGISIPDSEHRIGLPEALRLVKAHMLEKDSHIEELKGHLEGKAGGEGEGSMDSSPELNKLKEELAAKEEEIQKLASQFDFIPKPEDPEAEPISPEMFFKGLEDKMAEKELEISHFNEELKKLSVNLPQTENRIGLPEVLRLIQSQMFEKDQELEELKVQLGEGGTVEAPTDNEQLVALEKELEAKNEEIKKLSSPFSFIPTPEDPDVEPLTPELFFKELEDKIAEKDLEISHFNEELEKLSVEIPEIESRIGLPEALRLVQTKLLEQENELEELKAKMAGGGHEAREGSEPSQDWEKILEEKDQVIRELKEEIMNLKAMPETATSSPPEEVYSESVGGGSSEDWFAIQKEFTLETQDSVQENGTVSHRSLNTETEALKAGFEEVGLTFNRSLKEFLPASVYEKLEALENEGLSISDQHGHFLIFNQELQNMIGYSREEANDERNQSFLERLYPDPNYRAEVGRNISKIPDDGTFDTNKAYMRSKDGSIQALNVSSTSFYFSGKKYYLSYYTPSTDE